MKPKTHSSFSPKHMRGQTRISIQTTVSSFATLCILGMSAPHLSAATSYTIKPSATQLNWNQGYVPEIPEVLDPPSPAIPAVPSNWTPEAVAGAYPGTATGDTALVTGAFGGTAQTVDISATLANPLVALTLGDTSGTGTTTIQTTNASSLPLNAASIISQGPLVSPANTNIISAPITLTGGLTIAIVPVPVAPAVATTSNTDLTISGKITPSAAAARTINNSSGKTLTLGDIDISTSTTAAILTFRNENNLGTNRINLRGVIANGSSVASGVIFDGRFNSATANVFEIGNNSVLNTFTGAATLQSNGAGGRVATFLINSDQPFGTGSGGKLTVGQASGSTTILQAVNAARTIANPNVDMARNNTFQGSNNITFSGTITTGSSHIVTNDMTGGGQLIFGGQYNLDNSNQTTTPSDSRVRTFGGAGITVFNGVLADHASPTTPGMFGAINLTAAGTIILNGTATYQGDTRITGAGTIQLGNGGTTGVITPDYPNVSYEDFTMSAGSPVINPSLTYPAFVKKPVVTGGTTGTGTFAVKHSDDIVLSQTLNGGIGLKHIGSGVLTVATPQFNAGSNQVGDGISPSKLVVNAAAAAETTLPGDFGAPAVKGSGYNTFYQVVTLADTSTLVIGQPAYITTASAACYIHSIDSPTQITLMGTGITSAATGLIAGQNTSGPVSGQAIKFGAGSSLGTSATTTTVKALSTLAGTGAISGAVTVDGILAPGSSVGTLSTGPLKFNSGSTLAVEIDTTALTSDKVVVNGSVTAGGSPTLTLTDVGGDVALPNGTKFVLVDYSGTYATAGTLTYLGNPLLNGSSITVGANTFYVNYTDAAVDGTALTLTSGPAPTATAYDAWVNSNFSQLPTFSDGGPTLDPDKDGRDNLLEFALNGNPGSGSNNGKMVVSSEDSGDLGTNRDLSVTLAVRSGAVAGVGPGGSVTLTVDGIVYTIQGSQGLQTWDSAVDEVTPASTLTPAPDAGWETRTFRVTDSDGLPDKRFIRVGVQ